MHLFSDGKSLLHSIHGPSISGIRLGKKCEVELLQTSSAIVSEMSEYYPFREGNTDGQEQWKRLQTLQGRAAGQCALLAAALELHVMDRPSVRMLKKDPVTQAHRQIPTRQRRFLNEVLFNF